MTEILDEGAVSEIEARANAATKAPWHQSALAGLYIVADRTDFATIASVGEYNADGSIHLLFADAEPNLEFIVHAREDIPALCATVKHLRAQLKLSEDWRGTALRERDEAERLLDAVRKRADTNHATLNDLRAENERLKRMIETPDRSDSMKIGIPQSPLCGDVNCPLHGDHPNTCVAQPVCTRGYVPPVNNTLII